MRIYCFLILFLEMNVAAQVRVPFRTSAALGQEVFGNSGHDPFSFLRNTAALPRSGNGVSIYAENKYLLQHLHLLLAAATLKHRSDGFGAWLGWQGTSLFSCFAAAFAFGKSMGKVDAGLQLSYHSLRQQGYGQHRTIQASAGMTWALSPLFRTTVQVDHILRERTRDAVNDLLIEWGWGYQCSPEVLIWLQASKSQPFPLSWEGGIQYRIDDRFRISGGWKAQTSAPWLGCSWFWQKMMVSFYGCMHPVLGFTPGMQWGYTEKRAE
jgi:hypothetical protein